MDIRRIFSVEVRRVNTERALVRIDGLNEAESNLVYKNLRFPTTRQKGEYMKVLLYEEMVTRQRDVNE